MATHHDASSQTNISDTRLLAVSFSFPPLAYPRSIQVARLVKYLPLQTALVGADERDARRDLTLEPDAGAALVKCLRVPFSVSKLRRYANAAAYHFHRPTWNRWNRRPDEYRAWIPNVLDEVKKLIDEEHFAPDVLATFSQPVVSHLIGLELKRRYRLPWIAHFSDPWTDNPFFNLDAATMRVNLALERQVIEAADRLIFTSQETIDLLMRKYPPAWKSKTRVLPQSFDPALYPSPHAAQDATLRVRHVGVFYGQRTPTPLFRAIHALLSSDPNALRDVAFELIGVADDLIVRDAGLDSLPDGLVTVRPPVGYRESLALMSHADGLLVIDAPSEESVFLPSKLIDYTGAGQPILGLTPPGAAAKLITRLGGWVADPTNDAAATEALRNFLSYLRDRRSQPHNAWGEPDVRRQYEAIHLAQAFAEIVKELRAQTRES